LYSGAEYSGAEYSGAEYSGAEYSGGKYSGAKYSEAEYSRAKYSGAKYSEAEYSRADRRQSRDRARDWGSEVGLMRFVTILMIPCGTIAKPNGDQYKENEGANSALAFY
jgi:hypothetical protein